MKQIHQIDFHIGNNTSEQNFNYEFLSKSSQNQGFLTNENQTVNLRDNNFSEQNINFDYEFKQSDE